MDIRQLYPGAVRPIRWNPLQVPRRIRPIAYRNLIVEMFANAGRMGARQLGFMREALTTVYKNAGVLVIQEGEDLYDDSEVPSFPRRSEEGESARDSYIRALCAKRMAFRKVRNLREERAVNTFLAAAGIPERPLSALPVAALTDAERQALAVYRSKACSLSDWSSPARSAQETRKRPHSRTSLQGCSCAWTRWRRATWPRCTAQAKTRSPLRIWVSWVQWVTPGA